jgi:membrane-bound lytic murein transglycosylase MltF
MKNKQNPESRGRIFRSWFNVLVLACGLAACGRVMQVTPTTAANPPIGISDVAKLEPNINAGIKLLKYIRDDYFRDDSMDPLNKTLITLAAYNAGPARLKQCRRLAADMGFQTCGSTTLNMR